MASEAPGKPNWSGAEALAAVRGTFDQFPPIRVLFLAHRVRARGRLEFGASGPDSTVSVDGGRIVGCTGMPDLLAKLGVSGSAGDDLSGLMGKAIAAGKSPVQALEAAGAGLGLEIVATAGARGGHVAFDSTAPPPAQPIPIMDAIPRILANGLKSVRPPDLLNRNFGPMADRIVHAEVPTDSPVTTWGLDAVALRLLKAAGQRSTVADWVGAAKDIERGALLLAVDLLVQLGLVVMEEGATYVVGGPQGEPSRAVRRAAEPDPRQAELLEARDRIRRSSPLQILGIEKAADADIAGVDRAFLRVTVRYHPDRFAAAPVEVRKLAQECFEAVVAARDLARDPALLAEAAAKLKAREEGKVWVGAQEKLRARQAFASGEEHLKARRWEDAARDLETVVALDPEPWRYRFLHIQCQWRVGKMESADAVAALRALPAPPGAALADVLAVAGEVLLHEGREDEAFVLFEESVAQKADNATARRRLWLRDRRSREATVPGIAGLFRKKTADGEQPG